MTPDDVLLDLDGFCTYLSVSRATYYRWKREGRTLPISIVVGPKCHRWRLSDIKAWLAEKSATPER